MAKHTTILSQPYDRPINQNYVRDVRDAVRHDVNSETYGMVRECATGKHVGKVGEAV